MGIHTEYEYFLSFICSHYYFGSSQRDLLHRKDKKIIRHSLAIIEVLHPSLTVYHQRN